ncbi:MAG: mechanosensitive ion channel family protein [Saprospiraceae bacterium]
MNPRLKIAIKVAVLASLILLIELWPLLYNIEPFSGSTFGGVLNKFRPFLRFATFALALNIALLFFNVLYRRRKALLLTQDDAIILGMRNVYYIIVAFLIFGAIISLYGIDFTTLFTSLSIIAAAIAILTRDFIFEILSGLVMSFSGQLSVDDYISIGTTKGRVTTLTLTKVVLLNEDEDLVHIPNTKVFGGELVNYTQRMLRRVSIEFEVALSAIASVDDFEQELIKSLEEFSDSVVENSYSLRVVDLRKDSANLKFRYNLHQRSFELERNIRKKTSRAVISYVGSVNNKKGEETSSS